MTKDEYDNTHWTAKMTCSYQGIERDIASLSFEERLIGLVEICEGCEEGDLEWVRCESVHLNLTA